MNCHLFGTSKLGDNFYINLALFSGDEINLSITVRSKDKAVKDIIYKELLNNKFVDVEEAEEAWRGDSVCICWYYGLNGMGCLLFLIGLINVGGDWGEIEFG